MDVKSLDGNCQQMEFALIHKLVKKMKKERFVNLIK